MHEPTGFNTGGNASPSTKLRLVPDDGLGRSIKNCNSLYKNYQQFLSNKSNLDAHLLKFMINAEANETPKPNYHSQKIFDDEMVIRDLSKQRSSHHTKLSLHKRSTKLAQ